jgi:hypothetical protein
LLLAATGCASGATAMPPLARVAAADPGAPTSDVAPALDARPAPPAPAVDQPEPAAILPEVVEPPTTDANGPQLFLLMDDPPRCPAEMALVLEGVCVDRWESTLVLVLADGEEQPWSPFTSPSQAPGRVRAISQPNVVPQAYISGVQAERACAASGKRLCTAGEWEAACRGPAETTYPYGNARQKRRCNDAGRRVHPVAEVTKRLRLPQDRMWYEGMDHPLINQLEGTLGKTGGQEDCTNEYGVFDMVGNLHEWIEDPDGTFRGGYYMDTVKNGEGCDYATPAHSKKYHDYSTGFRCCMDADSVE